MKKSLIILSLLLAGLTKMNAQFVVDAPILEGLTTSLLTNQLDQKVDAYQTQLNTLQTAKSSFDTYEQLRKVNERIDQVSNSINEFRDLQDIIKISANSYQEVNEALKFINKYEIKSNSDVTSVASRSVASLQSSIRQLENIIKSCQKFLSSDMKMSDFERKTLLDNYKLKAQQEAYKIYQMRKKYAFAVGINAL